jgi:hypothetical protein
MNREAASALRKRLRELLAERRSIEEPLFDADRLLRGSLIEKYELAGGKKRSSPAFYLSVPYPDGRRVFEYVHRPELDRACKDNEAYRRFRKSLSRLRGLSREILKELDELGKCLEVPLR